MSPLCELTVRERAQLDGTGDFYLGVPLGVWNLVAAFNRQAGREFRDCVNVMAAPLLRAIYEAGVEDGTGIPG
jgi:hypothetical protein